MVKVSIIMPIYNVENYLEDSLNSVINQTLKDIEIICINDGSTDKSLEILNSYAKKDNRILVFSQKNKGQGFTRNKGLGIAKGEYVYFMDSDDILNLNALEKTYNVSKEKQLDFVIFQAESYDDEEDKYYKNEYYSMNRLASLVENNIFNYSDIGKLIFEISVTPWSKLYNRQFIIDCGAKFPEGLIFEDNVFFWEVLFSAKKIYFLKEILYTRRVYSTSSSKSGDQKFLDYIPITDLVFNVFKKYDLNEKYEGDLYNIKISTIYQRFKGIREEYKEIYFKEMKENFTTWVLDINLEYIQTFLTEKNKVILNAVLNENTSREFDLSIKNQDLVSKNIKLNHSNERLKHSNERLNQSNQKLKKSYNQIISSRSWKFIENLRKLKRIFNYNSK